MKDLNAASTENHDKTIFHKDRSKWEIVRDLLRVIKEENHAKKTRIMHKAYLDWRNFNKYFDFLIEEGFITNCDSDTYKLTEKGEELRKRLFQVNEMLNRETQ